MSVIRAMFSAALTAFLILFLFAIAGPIIAFVGMLQDWASRKK